MKRKALIATVAALTFAMSSMTAFATSGDVDTDQTDQASDLTAPGGDETAQVIDGKVYYINKTIYKVTLPTTTGITSFVLDPQGLMGTEGAIISQGTMTAINKSSVDINLTSSFYVTDSAGTLTLVDSADNINDKQQQVYLVVQDDSETADTYKDAFAITSLSADTPSSHTVKMAAAAYEVTGDATNGFAYTIKTDEEGSKLNMKLAGSMASEYDWSAYTAATDPETIKVNALFKFEDAGTVVTDAWVTNSDGSISYTFSTVPEGNLTGISFNGTAKNGQIGSNITYEAGTLSVNAVAVSAFVSSTGTTTISATIGGTAYTVNYTAE